MPRSAPYGFQRHITGIYVPLPAGTGAAEIVTDYTPGFGHVIEKVEAFVAIVGTGLSASRTVQLIKNAATVVATRTLVLADTATLGARIPFTVTAADAEFDDDDTWTVDFAAGGTAFTGGAVSLIVQYRALAQRVR